MPYEFKAVRRVEFSETDMAGIVHFSNFFRYMEKRSRVLNYLFRFNKLAGESSILVATGVLTVVCVAHDRNGKMEAVSIPPALSDKIEVAPIELLQVS